LQRTWKDNGPDMDKKMASLTQTIIEQIDTLSTIATEFSNFAKMPKANLESIDLKQVLHSILDLYKDSGEATLRFRCSTNEEAMIMADRDQLLRVFNNLVKNAIQAIPEDRKGEIEITLDLENDQYLVAVKDNGSGISDDAIEKIFMPNFTTKTGGMGLGLAMVKNILEGAGGKIWFETKAGQGTTFYLTFPVAI
jgi:signal transduction histidine kinase